MSSQIIQKQSGVNGKIPLLSDLELGEFAVNTYDGKIFLKTFKEYFDANLQENVTEEEIVEFTSSIPIENTLHVQKSGDDNNDGKTWDTAFASIEAAVKAAEARNSLTMIEVGPGEYYSKGHIDVPDNTVIHAVHRSVFFRPEPGYEERNVFRLGSGCFLEGIIFENWRVDDLENPTEGFAVVFRPGAKITRVPYAHKIAVRTPPYWSTIAPPLDRENNNPLVGRGGGVIMADASVIDPDSIYPNIMAWGATPVTHNGIGYCAKNGGLINAVNAISMWANKHFYAIDGGQIILSACSTQFGDYTLVAKGTRNIIVPNSVEDAGVTLVVDESSANLINSIGTSIINGLITELNTEGFTENWPTNYETLTERDAGLFLQALVWTLQTANEKPLLDYAKGFFNTQGDRAFTDLNYNYDKCYRDTQLITDAIKYDVLFDSNYRSIKAALAYYRANSSEVLNNQLESTLAAITEQKTLTANYLEGTSLQRSNALFDEILDILENGESAADAFSLTDPVNYNTTFLTGYGDARTLISNNKTQIQDDLDAWIAAQISGNISPFTSGFTYDAVACRRDVGLIIEALIYDLTYGGNLETYNAAVAYFVGTQSQLGAGEKAATLAAYSELKNIIGSYISGVDAGAITFVNSRIDDIIGTINSDGTPPTKIIPDLTWPADEFTISFARLTENTNKISEGVMHYLSTIYTDYNYDKCYRDILLINQAIAYDIMFDSNVRTINAGLAYYRQNASKVVNDQLDITIQAITRQQQVLESYINPNDFVLMTRSDALFTELLDIIQNGTTAADPYSYPFPTGYNNTFLIGYADARVSLTSSKTEIQDDLDTWIAAQISGNISPFSTSFTYDAVACRRDVGYIIDAITYDLSCGGNLETYNAAIAYFVGTQSQLGTGEKAATLAAYSELKNIISGYFAADNVTGDPVAFTLARIDDVIGTISSDGTPPVKILPATDWVNADYKDLFDIIINNTNVIANDVLRYINVENKTLLGAFIYSWEYMRDQINSVLSVDINTGPTTVDIVNETINAITKTILNPTKQSEPSTITAIGHTWTGIMAGVALTKIPPVNNQNTIQESILELDRGQVIASGQDDQGSALFIGGMEINADTGELSGPPFDTAVNRIATRAAIARSF